MVTSEGRPRRRGRVYIRALAMLTALLILIPPTAAQDIMWEDIAITVVDSWDDPLGEGEELLLDVSPDGSKLALAGTGGRGELRVTDRDLATIAVLSHPSFDIHFKGVRWSEVGTWLAAWGIDESQDGDLLRFWNATTLEPTTDLVLNTTVYLETIHAVQFLAYDLIIALSGLDENGTSRVLLTETRTGILLQNIEWRDGLSVLFLGNDMRGLLCIDETGDVTFIGGSSWTNVTLFKGRGSRPTAHSAYPPMNKEWLVGYEDGWFKFWGNRYRDDVTVLNITDKGPVQGIAWAYDIMVQYFVVAVPGSSGGSSIVCYFLVNASMPIIDVTWEQVGTVAAVTLLLTDPSTEGLVWTAFADGSVTLYRMQTISNAAPQVTIEMPEHDEAHTKPFLAHGTVVDDHDRLVSVQVQIDEGNWFDANVSGEEWSYKVGTDFLKEGGHTLYVDAFDGRSHTIEQVRYHVPHDRDD
ncbi:MAG: hypothetical protein KAJ35_10300, partial [Thermoplasmata archaeon]|nr:hypothetical protein [Thermoplasmata archaeon]